MDSIDTLRLQQLLKQNRHQDISRYSSLALSLDHVDATALRVIGFSCCQVGKFSAAAKIFNRIFHLVPSDINNLVNLSVANMHRGDLVGALVAIEGAAREDPYDEHIVNCYAEVLGKLGRAEDAVSVLKKKIAVQPTVRSWNSLAKQFMALDNLDDAEYALERAFELDPTHVKTISNLGHLYHKRKNYVLAREQFQTCINIDPHKPDYKFNMAIALYFEGKVLAAQRLLEAVLLDKFEDTHCAEILLAIALQNPRAFKENSIDKSLIKKILLGDVGASSKNNIQIAIFCFLWGDFSQCKRYLELFSKSAKAEFDTLSAKDKIFCSAYFRFLTSLTSIDLIENDIDRRIYHIGDSHCLSFAHRRLKLDSKFFTVYPLLILGGKAYHLGNKYNNHFKFHVRASLDTVPQYEHLLISFGEIDCRYNEGFLSAILKLEGDVFNLVEMTAENYVKFWKKELKSRKLTGYINGVPAPVYDESLDQNANEMVLKVVKSFNSFLSSASLAHGLKFLDIYKHTCRSDGFSNNKYHIDKRHLAPHAASVIELEIFKSR